MQELLKYNDSDFSDLASLMQELSGSIVFTRDSLDRMLADPNSHLYVIREVHYTRGWALRRRRRIAM